MDDPQRHDWMIKIMEIVQNLPQSLTYLIIDYAMHRHIVVPDASTLWIYDINERTWRASRQLFPISSSRSYVYVFPLTTKQMILFHQGIHIVTSSTDGSVHMKYAPRCVTMDLYTRDNKTGTPLASPQSSLTMMQKMYKFLVDPSATSPSSSQTTREMTIPMYAGGAISGQAVMEDTIMPLPIHSGGDDEGAHGIMFCYKGGASWTLDGGQTWTMSDFPNTPLVQRSSNAIVRYTPTNHLLSKKKSQQQQLMVTFGRADKVVETYTCTIDDEKMVTWTLIEQTSKSDGFEYGQLLLWDHRHVIRVCHHTVNVERWDAMSKTWIAMPLPKHPYPPSFENKWNSIVDTAAFGASFTSMQDCQIIDNQLMTMISSVQKMTMHTIRVFAIDLCHPTRNGWMEIENWPCHSKPSICFQSLIPCLYLA